MSRTKPKIQPVRCSEQEAADWKRRAEAAGLTVSDYIRRALEQPETGVAPRRRPRPAPPADPQVVRQVARAGNNLNQIARWCNTYTDAADQVQLLAALQAIERELSSFSHRPIAGGDSAGEAGGDSVASGDADQDASD
jgi:hypothetical protein